MAAINCTGSAEGALVPVLLRITHWPKSGLPVSPPGLFPPCGDGGVAKDGGHAPAHSVDKNMHPPFVLEVCNLFLSGIFKEKKTQPYQQTIAEVDVTFSVRVAFKQSESKNLPPKK